MALTPTCSTYGICALGTRFCLYARGGGKIDPEAITDILDPEGEKKVCKFEDTKVGCLDCLI